MKHVPGWDKAKNFIGITYFQPSSSFIYFLRFCQFTIYAELIKIELSLLYSEQYLVDYMFLINMQ